MRTTEHNAHFNGTTHENVVMKYRYDIKGQLLEVTDPLDRVCFAHVYDTAGNNLWTEHLDSGIKRLAVDAQGKPLYSTDAKGAMVLTAYDALNRPSNIWARDAAAEAVTLSQHMVYGDAAHPDPLPGNHLGKLWKHYDEAGLATITAYDFKGNPLEKVRQVVADSELTATEKYVVDWDGLDEDILDAKEYVTGLLYDGLNRVRKSILPEDVDEERKELVPTYNRAGALETITFDGVPYVHHIAYNTKGQRVLLAMGNGMMTRYVYDPITFRLQRIKTERYEEEDHEYEPQSGSTKQDSAYEYDLGGNILKIKERVSDCGIDGTVLGVDALDRLFQYDPLKRLLQATGRESDTQGNSNHWEEKPAPGSPNAEHTRAYTQSFQYDKVGNILKLGHQAGSNNYNRHYRYASGLNKLEQLDDNGGTPTVYASFTYDATGNQLTINTDRFFEWDAADQLRYFKIDDGTTVSVQAHYLYAGGNRVKKLVRDQQGNVEVTVYIDGVYEHRYRKDSVGDVEEEQNILHVMDGRSRIATVRIGDAMDDPGPPVKYNLEDHLGTSTTRLTDDGTVIDREEYYPFGESSLRTFEKKRYRYVGKERDEESGLYYYGARYYAAWTCRFVSVDPLAPKYPHYTPYQYAGNKPITKVDIDGLEEEGAAAAPIDRNGTDQVPDALEVKTPDVSLIPNPRLNTATIGSVIVNHKGKEPIVLSSTDEIYGLLGVTRQGPFVEVIGEILANDLLRENGTITFDDLGPYQETVDSGGLNQSLDTVIGSKFGVTWQGYDEQGGAADLYTEIVVPVTSVHHGGVIDIVLAILAGRWTTSTKLPPAAKRTAAAVEDAKIVRPIAQLEAGAATRSLTQGMPPNNGFLGDAERVFLQPGQIIDRYGGGGRSRWFSPQGTPLAARSAPPASIEGGLRSFRVLKPLEVEAGIAAPWHGQPGLGMQYVTPVRLDVLLKRGFLKEITP